MKNLLLALSLSIFAFSGKAQTLDSTALILIDIQNFYFPGGRVPLEEPEKAAQNAKILLEHFRENDGLVVHVCHDFEPGGAIHELVSPMENEKVITKKEVNAFLNTDLHAYLQKNNINHVILVGMQTHMCLEGGTRAAYDLGYQCTVVADACATRDLEFEGETIPARKVHLSTLATLVTYAKVMLLDEYLNPEY